MVTTCALDPLALLGSLPVLERIFPDQLLENGGSFLASNAFQSRDSYLKDAQSDEAANLKNTMEKLKMMDLTKVNKILYTTSNSSSNVQPVASFSISALFSSFGSIIS